MSITNIILALGLASTSSAVRLQSQSWFSDIGDAISGAADDASNWTKGAVHDASDTISGAADDASDWTKGAVTDASHWTKGAVHDASHWTKGAAHDTAHWTKGAVNDTGKFLNKEKDTIVNAVTGQVTADGLRRLGTEAGEAAEEGAEEALASAAEAGIPPV